VQLDAPMALRCWFSNAMHPATLQADLVHVLGGSQRISVREIHAADEGRSMQLLFDQPLSCDTLQVVVGAMRDSQNGRMDPLAQSLSLVGPCVTPAFLVRQIQPGPTGFLVRFSEPPAADAALVATYVVHWDGVPQSVATVQLRTTADFFVEMQEPLRGRGIPYHIAVDAQLRSAAGAPLVAPSEPHEVLFAGSGAMALFVAPNPVRAGTPEVSFLEAANDTRVTVYNLEGEHVVTLSEVRGGALRWDLRTQSGSQVSSGTYLYIAQDSTGRSMGRVVILR
jgi:hypothetical protein